MTLVKRLAKGSALTHAELDDNFDHFVPGSDTTAPTTAPDYVGQVFVDTNLGQVFLAVGTSGSGDWVQANLSGAQVKALYEAESDTNAFTDASATKLTNIAANATNNTGALADLNTVDTAQIENNAVTNAKLANGSVTFAKQANAAQNTFIGRVSAGSGLLEALSVSQMQTALDIYTGTNLASTASGLGASLIGVQDSVGNFSAADVEGVLVELQTNIDTERNYNSNTYLQSGDIKGKVNSYNAGGDPAAARPTGSTQISWFNWHQNGKDEPDNVGTNDIYNAPAGLIGVQNKTGNYTFADTDRGTVVRAVSGTLTFTIEDEATVPITYGSSLQPSFGVVNSSGNNLTLAGDTGVSINGTAPGSVTIPDGGSGFVFRTAANTWIYIGTSS